jgi:hypothetical protein
MNVDQLIESGANVKISFHRNKDLNEAYNKLAPFKHLGEIKLIHYEGSFWATIETDDVQVTAFYGKRTKK